MTIETCPVCGGRMPRGTRRRLSIISEILNPPWGGYVAWGESRSTLICSKCVAAVEMLLQRMREEASGDDPS